MTGRTLAEKVKAIVNKHDPIGLFCMGCPDDEYSPEIERIVPKLQGTASVEQLHDEVYRTFVDMFGDLVGPKDDYKKLSDELYSLKLV